MLTVQDVHALEPGSPTRTSAFLDRSSGIVTVGSIPMDHYFEFPNHRGYATSHHSYLDRHPRTSSVAALTSHLTHAPVLYMHRGLAARLRRDEVLHADLGRIVPKGRHAVPARLR